MTQYKTFSVGTLIDFNPLNRPVNPRSRYVTFAQVTEITKECVYVYDFKLAEVCRFHISSFEGWLREAMIKVLDG